MRYGFYQQTIIPKGSFGIFYFQAAGCYRAVSGRRYDYLLHNQADGD